MLTVDIIKQTTYVPSSRASLVMFADARQGSLRDCKTWKELHQRHHHRYDDYMCAVHAREP